MANNITVERSTKETAYFVAKNMRERDFEEVAAVNYLTDREELATCLAERYGDFPMSFTIGRDGVPIATLSAINVHPGLWSVGMWATEDFPKIGKFMTRFISNEFFGAMRAAGMHRVECKSIVGYDSVHKWLLHAGFRQGATEEKYGAQGQDFITFEWVEGMDWPRDYQPPAED